MTGRKKEPMHMDGHEEYELVQAFKKRAGIEDDEVLKQQLSGVRLVEVPANTERFVDGFGPTVFD